MKIRKIKSLSGEEFLRLPKEDLSTLKGEIVNSLIRQKYSLSAEISILRQRDTKVEEFEEYNAFAELCKQKANEIIQ